MFMLPSRQGKASLKKVHTVQIQFSRSIDIAEFIIV